VHEETSVKMTGDPAEIRTVYLLNTSTDLYIDNDLLGKKADRATNVCFLLVSYGNYMF